ncbi:2Fe-2S iron-sulfur cluster-binding protein [Pedobacter ginsengisoli]|uniref:2Fe-2S iron-sulfur cluster-binding protein n=1 Tax=Pedobacter ginsengisoli TaxID=363852 RepID=UPI00254BA9DE|nr:2Fe-2S iron-sulfur cluster-binding protein [Pedobacter ginsengisoli]
MTNELINFIVIESGKTSPVSTFKGEYRDLMTLLKDKLFLDSFGECGGMGRCATCLVEIDSKENGFIFERNETVTLLKHNITEKNCRLSCQMQVDENLEGLYLKII